MNKIKYMLFFLIILLVSTSPIMARNHFALGVGVEFSPSFSETQTYFVTTSLQLPFWNIFYGTLNILTPSDFSLLVNSLDAGLGMTIPLAGFYGLVEASYIFYNNPKAFEYKVAGFTNTLKLGIIFKLSSTGFFPYYSIVHISRVFKLYP